MVKSNMIAARTAIEATGSQGTMSLQKLFDEKVQAKTEALAFTMASYASTLLLTTATGIISTGADALGGLFGGICASKVTDLAVFNDAYVAYGSNGNLVEIVPSSPDMNLEQNNVYAYVCTTATDGDAVDATNLQLSFLEENGGVYTEYQLPAGDYTVQLNQNYTVGSAVDSGVLSKVFGNGGVNGLGFTEQEILDLVGTNTSHFCEFILTQDVDLGATKVLHVELVGATAVLTKDDGSTVVTNDTFSPDFVTSNNLAKGIASKFAINGGTVELDGVNLRPVMVDVEGVNKLSINFSSSVYGTVLYQDSVITIEGV